MSVESPAIKEARTWMSLPQFSNEKVLALTIGVVLAAQTWLWNRIADSVLDGQKGLRDQITVLESRLADLRADMVAMQIRDAEAVAELRERQNLNIERIERMERQHERLGLREDQKHP